MRHNISSSRFTFRIYQEVTLLRDLRLVHSRVSKNEAYCGSAELRDTRGYPRHGTDSLESNPTITQNPTHHTIPTEFKTIFKSINDICFPVLDCKLFNAVSMNIHNLYTILSTILCGFKGMSLCSVACGKHADKNPAQNTCYGITTVYRKHVNSLSTSSVTCCVDISGHGNFLSSPTVLCPSRPVLRRHCL